MQLAEDMGMKVERRPVPEEELLTFEEAGACGTAAVISPIERIDDVENGKSYVIAKDGKPGQMCIRDSLYPGLSSWQINFYKDKDEEGKEIKSEMITIEFFTDANKGATLQEGVYTIEHKFEPMYALPGYMMFNKADILYTWYGDKRSDDET